MMATSWLPPLPARLGAALPSSAIALLANIPLDDGTSRKRRETQSLQPNVASLEDNLSAKTL
jgi:hypothetical protein